MTLFLPHFYFLKFCEYYFILVGCDLKLFIAQQKRRRKLRRLLNIFLSVKIKKEDHLLLPKQHLQPLMLQGYWQHLH